MVQDQNGPVFKVGGPKNFQNSKNSVAPYLFNYGTEEQKMRYLPEMTSGECITCIGMTEPSGGSDLQSMKTFAKKDGDDYILNGSKVGLGPVRFWSVNL